MSESSSPIRNISDTARWLERATKLDPNRAVAYINLGDAYLNLKRNPEARQAYEKYLQLTPAGRSAAYVQEKLKSLTP